MSIAGDIGGTNVRLAYYSEEETKCCLHEARYPSREFSNFPSLLKKFLETLSDKKIQRATFGIAGPVQEGVCRATNLPWVVSEKELEKELGIPKVFLINDLEANAWGLACLDPEEFCILNIGEEKVGNQALISAGTGLGEAGLYWDGVIHRPFACEGGHCDFAPTTEEEIELLRFLNRQFGRTSFERILSGSGLAQIYRFLIETKREQEEGNLPSLLHNPEPQKEITERGLKGSCQVAIKTCELFSTIYGSEAGNLALKFLSTGGLFIGGGLAPHLVPFLQKKEYFLKAFLNKGRLSSVLMNIPIRVVLNDRTALLGAARYGREQGK